MLNKQSSNDANSIDYPRLDADLMDNIDLTPFTDQELFALQDQWRRDDKMVMSFTIKADTGEVYDHVKVDPEMSIYDFKRVILNCKNKAFFLEQDMDNQQTVTDLLELIIEDQ